MPYLVGYPTPQDYGATGDGVHDDTSAIQSALNAAPLGGVVYLPPGTYATTAPITIPPQVTLLGSHSSHIDATTCSIRPLASFSGSAIITMVDQATGGYSVPSTTQGIFFITLDGSNLGGSIHGILATGYVHGVTLQDVQIIKPSGNGVTVASNGSGNPYSWRGTRVAVTSANGYGFSLSNMTDCTWIDLEAIAGAKSGFFIQGAPSNAHFISCRAEYNNFDGFTFQGSWGNGGGCTFTSCSTDGNNKNGMNFSATGNSPIVVEGYMSRRDGANGTSGGGGYAGLSVNTGANLPLVVTGLSVYVGVAQGGGANSPQYGISVTGSSSNLTVESGFIQAATTAWFDDGTNTTILRGPGIIERVGTQSSSTTALNGLQASMSGLDMVGHSFGMATPREHGLIAWTYDPVLINTGTAITLGTVYLNGVYVSRSTTVSNLLWGLNTAVGTPTAGQNFVGLYGSSGTLLTSAGVDASAGSTGLFTTAVTPVSVTPGMYWVGFLFNGASAGSPYRANSLNGTATNAGIALQANKRYVTNGTGQTSLPASITPSSNVTAQTSYWAALS